jgi:exodeoxyribonuclease V gamma subunit
MAIRCYISNQAEKLSAKFCDNIKLKADPFNPETIVTQTRGIDTWLSMEAARMKGVFANFMFLKPDDLLNRILRITGGSAGSYYTAGNMKWELYAILNSEAFKERFTIVANYFGDDDLKRLQLANEVADLFDQYMVYRPDYIQLWNSGQQAESPDKLFEDEFKKHEEWQQWLWSQLRERSGAGSLDKVQLMERLLQQVGLPEMQDKIRAAHPQISIFGLSLITRFHAELFFEIGKCTELNFYLLNFSPDTTWYLADEDADENELFGSCNKSGKFIYAHLLDKDNDVELFNLGQRPEQDSLLHTMQSDFFENSNTGIAGFKPEPDEESSIRIASSFTPVREVEALYNYLLRQFEKNPGLEPRDILVQLTDVSLYAPYIQAVFENGPVKIPYQLNDLAYTDGDTITNALETLFSLPFADYGSETVLKFLSSRFVRSKFDIEHIEEIRNLVTDANIRFGKKGRVEDDTRLVSWQHGLTKLLLGFTMKGGLAYEMDDELIYLTDNAEGSDAFSVFRLKAFIDTLTGILDKCDGDRELNEWKSFLINDVLGLLFEIGDDGHEEYEYIVKKISSMDFIGVDQQEKIPFTVFQRAILYDLKLESRNHNYYSGRLTFSAMISTRSMPFKAIAILGLNSNSFPRSQHNTGFNLMAFAERPGDRNIRENDKYLFMESLYAAREYLYLSYIGSSIKEGSELPPSILIEELLTYFRLGIDEEFIDNYLVIKHPMHGFSRKYFGSEPGLFTYLGTTEQAGSETDAEVSTKIKTLGADLDFSMVSLDDFIRFFKQPIKIYYNKTLKIYYSDEEKLIPEAEVFELDTLEQWQIKSDLIHMEDGQEQAYIYRSKSAGGLPLSNMARVALDQQKSEIEELKAIFIAITGEYDAGNVTGELLIGGSLLTANIKTIYGHWNIHINASKGKSQPKYIVEAWIGHLFLTALGKNKTTRFISKDLKFDIPETFIDQPSALGILKQLMAIYKWGHSSLIAFSPNTGKSLADKKKKEKDDPELMFKKAIEMLKAEGQTGYKRDYCDEYIQREIEQGFFEKPEEFDTTTLNTLSELLFGKLKEAELI